MPLRIMIRALLASSFMCLTLNIPVPAWSAPAEPRETGRLRASIYSRHGAISEPDRIVQLSVTSNFPLDSMLTITCVQNCKLNYHDGVAAEASGAFVLGVQDAGEVNITTLWVGNQFTEVRLYNVKPNAVRLVLDETTSFQPAFTVDASGREVISIPKTKDLGGGKRIITDWAVWRWNGARFAAERGPRPAPVAP